jgi:bla regulator protein BlaR1
MMIKSFARNLSLSTALAAATIAVWAVDGSIASGQVGEVPGAATPSSATNAAGGKAFDVVSVRQNKSGGSSRARPPQYGPTADGFRMTNMPLRFAIMTAYVPQSGGTLFTNDMPGMPDWAQNENYDIDAKVGAADLAEWREPALQTVMLRAMLQALLADRFKLAVHRDTKEVSTYSLVVGKRGPKLKETTPGEPHPGAMAIPGGGMMVAQDGRGAVAQFYDASMATLTPFLSIFAGRPVQDKTGLTGRYDFSLKKPSPMGSSGAGPDASDPEPTVFSAVEELGLKLEAAKGSVETLVIDHVERPSEN